MMTIHLNKIILFGYHGVYEEENILGGNFEINLDVSFNEENYISTIEQTFNYVSAYEIVKKHFATTFLLLETLAQTIVKELYEMDNKISIINISINKLHPPIHNFVGSVGIVYSKTFK